MRNSNVTAIWAGRSGRNTGSPGSSPSPTLKRTAPGRDLNFNRCAPPRAMVSIEKCGRETRRVRNRNVGFPLVLCIILVGWCRGAAPPRAPRMTQDVGVASGCKARPGRAEESWWMRFCAPRLREAHSGNSIGLPAREKHGVAMGNCRLSHARSTNTELAEAGLHECVKPFAKRRVR